MKSIIFLVWMPILWTTVFAQNLSFQFGTSFQRADLKVVWNVSTKALPSQVEVYRLLPKEFSPLLVSNLIALGSFTEKDRIKTDSKTLRFENHDGSKSLWISSALGAIRYEKENAFGFTNLAKHVPELAKLPELATNFLNLAGINIADLEKKPDGAPDFHAWEPFMTYSMNRVTVTNIGFRAINFRRSVAGFRFVGAGAGGDGDLQFGEHGRISKIRLSWRNLERHKSYPTVAPPTIMRWIREGKAVQGKIRMDAPPIDWRTVKSLTVTDAKICYYAGDGFAPSDWLMPFVALWTTVDTGHGKMDVEIDCPIIDTAKPSSPSN